MNKRIALIVAVGVFALVGARIATGGPAGLIWDDGHYARPGSLDDGKELRPEARISLAEANAAAQRAASGDLGRVDLEHHNGRLVYTVDVGDREVHVDALNGRVVAITRRD
jgi:uncharacterized membrane protein YkoI